MCRNAGTAHLCAVDLLAKEVDTASHPSAVQKTVWGGVACVPEGQPIFLQLFQEPLFAQPDTAETGHVWV
jgi:hypothetical protein